MRLSSWISSKVNIFSFRDKTEMRSGEQMRMSCSYLRLWMADLHRNVSCIWCPLPMFLRWAPQFKGMYWPGTNGRSTWMLSIVQELIVTGIWSMPVLCFYIVLERSFGIDTGRDDSQWLEKCLNLGLVVGEETISDWVKGSFCNWVGFLQTWNELGTMKKIYLFIQEIFIKTLLYSRC